MTPSALCWFIDLATHYPPTPQDAKNLALAIEKALKSKNQNIELNRTFRHKQHKEKLQTIFEWLDGDIRNATNGKKCQRTSEALETSVTAFKQIISGAPASEAWGMSKKRGADHGHSKTLAAIALAGCLAKNKDLGYSKTRAVETAATLFGISQDTIWQYKLDIKPIDDESEACYAYSAIVEYSLLDEADRYFDTEELKPKRI